MMNSNADKETRFLALTDQYKAVIAKVCGMYVSDNASFDDLYQEVLINLWQGMDAFRGDAKVSTWIYRTAINTCITWHRRNRRHGRATIDRLDDIPIEIPDDTTGNEQADDLRLLNALIARLGAIDKAILTLWLEENTYEEIGRIVGLSPGNIAVRLHRIKSKLAELASGQL